MFLYLRTLLLVASVIIAGSAEAQMRPIEVPTVPVMPAIPAPMPVNPSLTTPSLAAPSVAVPAAPSLAPAAPAVPVESAPAAQAWAVATQEVPARPAKEDSSVEAKCLCKDEDTGEEKCEISCCDKPDHSICLEPK